MAIASALHAAPTLPIQEVKQLYQEGEFEKVRTEIEAFLKNSNAHASREDRILAYKYLGVVYASMPEGTPQAEAYFFKLLDLSPQVQLTELYVSSSVDALFEKTRQRFQKERRSSQSVDEFGNPLTQPGEKMSEENGTSFSGHGPGARVNSDVPGRNAAEKNRAANREKPKLWPWALGAAVIGGGVGLYFITSREPAKKETVFPGTVEN